MVFLDMTAPVDDGVSKPGIYATKIAKSEQKESKAGNEMFAIRLVTQGTSQLICNDYIMLSGRGLQLGRMKLRALGFDESHRGEIKPEDLLGRTAYVATINEEYGGRRKLGVDINVGICGYFPSSEPAPLGVIAEQDVDAF